MSALPNISTAEWQTKLAARGILEAALENEWAYQEVRGVAGWSYPLYRFDGASQFADIKRWKAIDRKTAPAAYQWLGTKPDTCQYYWARGVKSALSDSWGVLYITAGEPDMLSMIAAGRRNVTSFFGEQNIPQSLQQDLKKIGVSQVIYLADMDNTGIDAAAKLKAALGDIPCDVKRLPPIVKDVNDLWIECQFDKALFIDTIDNLPLWSFTSQTQAKPYYNYEAYAEAVEDALNLKGQKRNGWSKPIACIFATHEQDERQPSAGWHYQSHTFRCFKCGQTWNCDEVGARLGIDLERFNENAGRLKIVKAQDVQITPQPSDVIYSSDESTARYIERLDGKHISEVSAAPFPFTVLHQLGGFCEILKPRKMIGVIGLSGGGKTSFLESMTDILRQAGEYHCFWWGKEWRWDEMADRAVQRHGGLTLTQVARYEMYLNEKRLGQVRYGVMPTEDMIEISKDIARQIQTWPGKAFYIDKGGLDLATTLEIAQKYFDEKRLQGLRIRAAVWDYASLFEVKGTRSELEKISTGLGMVKDFGETNDLFTFVASQPRKDDAERVKDGDKLLTAEDAMYMNDHKFNLLLTLNPQYFEGKMTTTGVINVVKNSGGDLGKVAVKMDLRHLRWLDEKESAGWE